MDNWKERIDALNREQRKMKCLSVWSVNDIEAEHLDQEIPSKLKKETLVYKNHWGGYPVEIVLEGVKTWRDLWQKADEVIRESKDTHHVFIEQFVVRSDRLELVTGS